MADRKQRLYLVTMNDKAKTQRLIQATSPQAARNYACKDVEARMATAMEVYKLGLTVENAPPDPEPQQASIPMTAPGRLVIRTDDRDLPLGTDKYDDDLRYASQP